VTDRTADASKFSVVVPAHNVERTLHVAIRSVLDQTLPALEVVVVDDGSSDSTAEIAATFGERVRLIRKENGGTASARNRGIAEARGDVICFLDADDRYEPGRLEAIAAKLEAEPGLDGVLTDALLVGGGGSRRASGWWPAAASRERLDIRSKPIFCALAVRRRVLDELGPFDSRFRLLEDVEMWHRLICRGHPIGYVDDPSYVYLLNDEGKTQSADPVDGEWELMRIQLRYALAPATPHRWRLRLLARATLNGKRSVAARVARARGKS
jgi:glycosyltransferase involved in cell wall biosynthesis